MAPDRLNEQRLAMAEFDYELSPEAIAHAPLACRDAARLLVDRGAQASPEHRHVRDLPQVLRAGDLLVLNETRVMPARLRLRKPTGGAAEVLLLEPTSPDAHRCAGCWAALVRPSRRIADGTVLTSERDPSLRVTVGRRLGALGQHEQRRAVRVTVGDVAVTDPSQAHLLALAGEAPLPPYINADPTAEMAERYQTVYARSEGSAAAPTAGLHLTERVLSEIAQAGISIAKLDLTVGLATFAPVTAEYADAHVMHSERYRVPAEVLAACDEAERVVAVGTTTVRALESAARVREQQGAAPTGPPTDVCGATELFLRRGSEFKIVDAMLTNFHLPRSSLLLLIDAFIGPRWKSLYAEALAVGYRFLSFGDAMLIEREQPQ